MSGTTGNDAPTKLPQGNEGDQPPAVPAQKSEPKPEPEPEKKPEPKAEPKKPTTTTRTYGERFAAFFFEKRKRS